MSIFPFEIKDVESKLNKELLQDFHGERTGFVQVGPRNYFFPIKYKDYAKDFYNFQSNPDDVWIATFPRSGTTVMQEMLYLICHDMDYEKAQKKRLYQRAPFLELNILVHDKISEEVRTHIKGNIEKETALTNFGALQIPFILNSERPHIIKTHLPFSLLNPKLLDTCKVVYMARNPMDVAVSFYHHNRLFTTQGYVADFPKYWQYFKQDLLQYGPYWQHILEAWKLKDNDNLLFLFYEDLVKDMKSTIKKVCKFLNKNYSDEEIEKLAIHLNIDNFKNNKTVIIDSATLLPGLVKDGEGSFIRHGKNNAWHAYFTSEMKTEADEWIEKNMKNFTADFNFPTV